MTRRYVKALFLFYLPTCLFLFLQPRSNAWGANVQENYHGTLNIVVAAPGALVAATDSRATITDGQGKVLGREDSHQKLFVIPGDIFVTIAGYNRVSVPMAPEFTAPAAAIILSYIDMLNLQKRTPPYDLAVRELTHLLSFHLTSVANINAWTTGSITGDSYTLQMIVAGKRNEVLVMTKVTLSLSLQKNAEGKYYVTSQTSNEVERPVTSFTYLTAGWDIVAQQVLRNSKQLPTLEELQEVVREAMKKTSVANQGVGGAIQQACLSQQGVSVTIPDYPRPPGPTIRYHLMIGGGFSHDRIAVQSDSPFLFITTSFTDSGVILDGNYFYGTHLKNCNVFVSRNAFTFDKTNTVENCRLYVGKKVDRTKVKYRQLSSRFAPQSIYYEREKAESLGNKGRPAKE